MKNFISLLSIIVLFSFILFGCSKEPGPGGKATINGEVYINEVDAAYVVIDEYIAQDYNVYIVYGDEDNYYDDKTKTNHNGNFQFEYLKPGKYSVYLFQECQEYPVGCTDYVKFDVEITEKEQIIDLGTIIVNKAA